MTVDSIKTIDVHELKNKMDTVNDCCLIDVREPHEWQAMRIPGAILIPKDEISEQIESKISNKNQAVYLHCRSGVRSLYAAQCLIDKGYQNVYSVDGGIMEWAINGYPVEK